jgi:hypothetical protein
VRGDVGGHEFHGNRFTGGLGGGGYARAADGRYDGKGMGVTGYPHEGNEEWRVTSQLVATPWDRGYYDNEEPAWALSARDQYVVSDSRTVENNALLRAGQEGEVSQRWLSQTDRLCETARLTEDRTVYRGAALSREIADAIQPGSTFTDKAYMSCSSDVRTSKNYLSSRMEERPDTVGVMFHLNLPAGLTFGYMDSSEFVMPRGSSITVQSVTTSEDGFIHVNGELSHG